MKVIYIYFIHIIGIDNMFFHASAKLLFYLGKDCFDLQPSWFDTIKKRWMSSSWKRSSESKRS